MSATLALALALAVPAVASATTPSDFPLKGWWPLNEGRGQVVNDWSGNRNQGYLGSTTGVDENDPAWIKGIFFGSALRFGGDDFVTIPASSSLQPQKLTISAWVRASSSPGSFKYIFAKGGDACVTASYALTTGNNGGLIFYTWVNGVQRHAGPLPASDVWDGRWHHVAGTWDGTQSRLYLDGNLTEGSTFSDSIDYSLPSPNAIIGGYHAGCDLLFTGDIDEVHVWSQALPVSDIWKKYSWLLGIPGQQQ